MDISHDMHVPPSCDSSLTLWDWITASKISHLRLGSRIKEAKCENIMCQANDSTRIPTFCLLGSPGHVFWSCLILFGFWTILWWAYSYLIFVSLMQTLVWVKWDCIHLQWSWQMITWAWKGPSCSPYTFMASFGPMAEGRICLPQSLHAEVIAPFCEFPQHSDSILENL